MQISVTTEGKNVTPSGSTRTKLVCGKTFHVEVEPWDSVESLKQQLAEKIGTAVELQVLWFNDIELHNGHILSEYNIQPDSALNVRTLGAVPLI